MTYSYCLCLFLSPYVGRSASITTKDTVHGLDTRPGHYVLPYWCATFAQHPGCRRNILPLFNWRLGSVLMCSMSGSQDHLCGNLALAILRLHEKNKKKAESDQRLCYQKSLSVRIKKRQIILWKRFHVRSISTTTGELTVRDVSDLLFDFCHFSYHQGKLGHLACAAAVILQQYLFCYPGRFEFHRIIITSQSR
jgi:hypothetical protein